MRREGRREDDGYAAAVSGPTAGGGPAARTAGRYSPGSRVHITTTPQAWLRLPVYRAGMLDGPE